MPSLRAGVHHVAYAAHPARAEAPIPENAGAGGSISHNCDTQGCCKIQHLEATPKHQDNMDRQRCSGVTLITYKGVIVQEIPCAHGKTTSLLPGGLDLDAFTADDIALHNRIRTSCIGLRVIELDERCIAAVGDINKEERACIILD
jgi:hypothetical protein